MRVSSTPTIIGIDDWAWKRGQRYGTVICDLERRQIIDILPDREAATVEGWLKAHPAIKIISRDRGGGYGHAAAGALPDARQVAKLNGLDPEAYLANIIDRMAKGYPANRLAELLPWNWAATIENHPSAVTG